MVNGIQRPRFRPCYIEIGIIPGALLDVELIRGRASILPQSSDPTFTYTYTGAAHRLHVGAVATKAPLLLPPVIVLAALIRP